MSSGSTFAIPSATAPDGRLERVQVEHRSLGLGAVAMGRAADGTRRATAATSDQVG